MRWLKTSKPSKSPTVNKRSVFHFKEIIILIIAWFAIDTWKHNELLPTDGNIIAPSFTLPSLSEQTIAFAAEELSVSQTPVLVFYFFAPWCSICHASIENLNTLSDDIHSGRVKLYIIALDWRSKQEVAQFVEQHQLPVEVLLGTRQQMTDYRVNGFPSYYIADSHGHLQWASVGYSTELGLKARITLTSN